MRTRSSGREPPIGQEGEGVNSRADSSTAVHARCSRDTLADGGAESSREAGDHSSLAEAYSSIAVISTLLFGSASSCILAVEQDRSETLPNQIYVLILVVVCMCSALSTIVMTLQFYHIKRLSFNCGIKYLEEYTEGSYYLRHVSRGCTWFGLALHLAAFSVHIYGNSNSIFAKIESSMLLMCAIGVIAVWRNLTQLFMNAKRRSEKAG